MKKIGFWFIFFCGWIGWGWSQDSGYGIVVTPKTSLAGDNLESVGNVVIGTEFNFGLSLRTEGDDNVIKGDFTLTFEVLDSSSVSLASKTINGNTNSEPFTFSYTLQDKNIVSGILTFLFEVKSPKGTTQQKLTYTIVSAMVASDISLSQTEANVGDRITVSIVPANFDLTNIYPYSVKDVHSKEIAKSRSFFADLKSPKGILLQSVKGTPVVTESVAKYTFTFDIKPTLDLLSQTNLLSFRYVTVDGENFELSNYDSKKKELENTPLSFSVKSKLVMTNVMESPEPGDFFYGNEISFKFQIKDSISGKMILAGEPESANVFLVLKNVQQDSKARLVTSTVHPATHYFNDKGQPEGFLIRWPINPNAVRGSGILSLVPQDADGNPLPLFKQNKDEEFKINVNIGGEFTIKQQTYISSSRDNFEAFFLVNFDLFCQERPLKDAHLKAAVVVTPDSNKDQEIELLQLPVAIISDGSYSVSWALPHEEAVVGNYRLDFYRDSDRIEKKTTPPLFTISFRNEGTLQLPVRTEFLVALALGLAYFAVSYKKAQY